MDFLELDPGDAHERLGSIEGALYLDVRTVPEFEAGHPEGAYNLPVLDLGPTGPMPNPRFMEVAEAHFDKAALLVVGCKSGQRSMVACRLLADAGFTRLVNVAGGFAGLMEPLSGRVLVEGWASRGLPSATQALEGRSYEEMLTRLG